MVQKQLAKGWVGDGSVADPDAMADAIYRAFSEFAVFEHLDVPPWPSPSGWLKLYLNDRSVGVDVIQRISEPLAYPALASFPEDIVVVAMAIPETLTVRLIGWTDNGSFHREHTRIERDGAMWCVLPQSKLLELGRLKELAEGSSVTQA